MVGTETQGAVAPSGQTLPDPGTYTLDPSHTAVTFSVRHLMVAKVRGRVAMPSGTVVIGDDPLASSVEATIDVASVDTGDEKRDAHLRSPDFLDAEHHATASFRSTRLEATGDATYRLHGDLTIKGVTKPVVLDIEYLGRARSPFGTTSIGFSAATEINRKDWGLEWNMPLETGGVLVGDKVKLEIEAEAIEQS